MDITHFIDKEPNRYEALAELQKQSIQSMNEDALRNIVVNFENYWDCLDDKFDELIENGYVKLPSIANLDLRQISSQISSQISDKTYTELNDEHKIFIGLSLIF